MTGANILTLLMSRLGSKTEAALRATCLSEMQLVQETQLEGGPTLPWFLVEADWPLVTVLSQRYIQLPTDFIREVDEEKPVYYVPASGAKVELPKMSYQEAMFHYTSTGTGVPKVYALRGDRMMIFPLPDAVYNLTLDYYKRQATPTDNSSENNWMKWASDLVMAATGEVVATQHLQDSELGMSFSGLRQMATDRLARMDVAREEANRDRRMG